METPPPNNLYRQNAYSRQEQGNTNSTDRDLQYQKHLEFYNKIHQNQNKNTGYNVSPINEKEIVSKMVNDIRKQIRYIEETNWMFENEDGILPTENIPNF